VKLHVMFGRNAAMSKKSADLILIHVFTVASTSKGRSCYITFIWEENSKFVVWFSFISGFIGIFINDHITIIIL
jgi:hypothetical protein